MSVQESIRKALGDEASEYGERLTALEEAVERLETAVFRKMPKPQDDGWITNGYPNDTASHELIRQEFGEIRIGLPKATKQRTAKQLKADGIIGIYVVKK